MTIDKEWRWRPRTYSHLDISVGDEFAQCLDADKVSKHVWTPLIRSVKTERRYRRREKKTVLKERLIMVASHQDACILSKYAHHLSETLELWLHEENLGKHVIAYRALGKSNSHFVRSALEFLREQSKPMQATCFDIEGFFDNIPHSVLKNNLTSLLNVAELPRDWFQVYRHVIMFPSLARDDLRKIPAFAKRLAAGNGTRVATIREVKDANISISSNKHKFGIAQGTPISAVLSNVCMMQFDAKMRDLCVKHGWFYQRYSDDILVICDPCEHIAVSREIDRLTTSLHLRLNHDKTETQLLLQNSETAITYLGFLLSAEAARVKPATLSKQWRKFKRAIKRARYLSAKHGIGARGRKKYYTKALRRRFLSTTPGTFGAYIERSAGVLDDARIQRQLRRLRVRTENELATLND